MYCSHVYEDSFFHYYHAMHSDQFLRNIVQAHGTTAERQFAIRSSFIEKVGGTEAAWEKLFHEAVHEEL